MYNFETALERKLWAQLEKAEALLAKGQRTVNVSNLVMWQRDARDYFSEENRGRLVHSVRESNLEGIVSDFAEAPTEINWKDYFKKDTT